MNVNVTTAKNCAFCKYWYDPSNSAIKPIVPNLNMWEYEDRTKRMCLKCGAERVAFASCSKFENKIV